MDYSVLGFDGLPDDLKHVKVSLEEDVMPKRWRDTKESSLVSLPVGLQEGFKGQQMSVCIHC